MEWTAFLLKWNSFHLVNGLNRMSEQRKWLSVKRCFIPVEVPCNWCRLKSFRFHSTKLEIFCINKKEYSYLTTCVVANAILCFEYIFRRKNNPLKSTWKCIAKFQTPSSCHWNEFHRFSFNQFNRMRLTVRAWRSVGFLAKILCCHTNECDTQESCNTLSLSRMVVVFFFCFGLVLK